MLTALMMNNLLKITRVIRNKKFSLHASSLAFQTLMVIFPLFALLFWYLRTIGLTEEWALQLQNFVLQHLNVDSGEIFSNYFTQILGNASAKSWGLLSLLVFIYSVSTLLYSIGETVDEILSSPQDDFENQKNWKNAFLLILKRFLIILCVPLLLIASSSLKAWVQNSELFINLFSLHTVGPWFMIPLSYSLDIIAIFSLYQFFPNKRILPLSSFKAAIIVTLTLSMGRWMIKTYGGYAFTTHKLYGVATAFILFMLWLQIAWMIFLIGLTLLKERKKN